MFTIETDRNDMFRTVLEHCHKLEEFQPSDLEVQTLRTAFDGLFKIRGAGFRKTPLSWTGFVSRDGTIDRSKATKCLQSAFCRLFQYHSGQSSAYLGTILNATENLASVSKAFGIAESTPSYWNFETGSSEYETAREVYDSEKAKARTFADHCDTFCQVFIYLGTNGKTSSVSGDQWSKALGGR